MPRRKARKGDFVEILQTLRNQRAYYKKGGKEGTTRITLRKGQRLKVANDEIGGNIYVETQTASGEEVLVSLAESEWKLA